jgi:hypothetical protein
VARRASLGRSLMVDFGDAVLLGSQPFTSEPITERIGMSRTSEAAVGEVSPFLI